MGFLAGITTAFLASFQNSYFKGFKDIDPFVLNWLRFGISIPVLVLLVTIFSGWTVPPPIFWFYLLGISMPLELGLSYFYVRAYQQAPQSIAGPLFSFSGIFLIPLGVVFLGEMPTVQGMLGVVSIIAGPFIMAKKEQSWFSVFRYKGSLYMLVSAFIGALGVTVAKFSFQYVSSLEFGCLVITMLFLYTSVILLVKRISPFSAWNRSFIGMGITSAFGVALHNIGLSLLLAAYFISIKRFSIVFDVLLGRIIHHEDHFNQRLVGSLLMTAGLVLIALES